MTTKILFKISLRLFTFSSIIFFSSCGSNNTNQNSMDSTATAETVTKPTELKPANPKPSWGKDMSDPMAVVLEKLESYKSPALPTLSAVEARKLKSPADAAMAVMTEHYLPMPANNVDTTGKDIPVQGGQIHLRIYTPNTGKAAYPVIVYYHGGGWVIADLNTYNASAQSLANQVEAVVVSVAYRQAPEHKFPTAHNDSYAAYQWTVKNAASKVTVLYP